MAYLANFRSSLFRTDGLPRLSNVKVGFEAGKLLWVLLRHFGQQILPQKSELAVVNVSFVQPDAELL
jgi:hypothetical protein